MIPDSSYAGIIVWSIIIVINIIVFSIISRPKKWPDENFKKILLSAVLSTTIAHAILAIVESVGAVLMWIIVSFPLVGFINVVILVILKFTATALFAKKKLTK